MFTATRVWRNGNEFPVKHGLFVMLMLDYVNFFMAIVKKWQNESIISNYCNLFFLCDFLFVEFQSFFCKFDKFSSNWMPFLHFVSLYTRLRLLTKLVLIGFFVNTVKIVKRLLFYEFLGKLLLMVFYHFWTSSMADKSKAIMAKFVLCLQPYKQLPFWSALEYDDQVCICCGCV